MNAEPVTSYSVGVRVTQDLEQAKVWAQQDIREEVAWACQECGTKYDFESLANNCCSDEDLLRQRKALVECLKGYNEEWGHCKERIAEIDAKMEKRIIRRALDKFGISEDAV